MRQTKVKTIPIWRISISDSIYYFVFGNNKKNAIETMKLSMDELTNMPIHAEKLAPDYYNNILLQTDMEDPDNFTTLAEEAKYIIENKLEKQFFIASSFDVIAYIN